MILLPAGVAPQTCRGCDSIPTVNTEGERLVLSAKVHFYASFLRHVKKTTTLFVPFPICVVLFFVVVVVVVVAFYFHLLQCFMLVALFNCVIRSPSSGLNKVCPLLAVSLNKLLIFFSGWKRT